MTPAFCRKILADSTLPFFIVGSGCGLWSTVFRPRNAIRCREPAVLPGFGTSAPSALHRARKSAHWMFARVGSSKIAHRVRQCFLLKLILHGGIICHHESSSPLGLLGVGGCLGALFLCWHGALSCTIASVLKKYALSLCQSSAYTPVRCIAPPYGFTAGLYSNVRRCVRPYHDPAHRRRPQDNPARRNPHLLRVRS